MTDKLWVPDYSTCWAGVRDWTVDPAGVLYPLTGGGPWPQDKDMIAECHSATRRHPNEFPPVEGCGCGLWAFYSPLEIVNRHDALDHYGISGLISAWGGIVPYGNGFRAECARVEAIFDHPAMPQPLTLSKRAIADAYGADVISPLYFDDYCERRGFILPEPDDDL
jgi:hypothetical protein